MTFPRAAFVPAVALALSFGVAANAARAAVVVPGNPETDLKVVADRVHSRVVVVRADAAVASSGDPQALGTTVSFGAATLLGDGFAVTALHTVGISLPGKMVPWKNIQVQVPQNGVVVAEVVAWFPEVDLALLRLPGTASISSLPLESQAPKAGAPLIALGADEEGIRVIGVASVAASDDALLLTSNHALDSRYWGGPLFDAEGNLAGIILPSTRPTALSAASLAAMLDGVRHAKKPAAVGI
ncbi:MAG TPA: trypsin-like peptidase domain-containing protein [Myxococcales bacterium]|jgi:S1-C subfamily serine protease